MNRTPYQLIPPENMELGRLEALEKSNGMESGIAGYVGGNEVVEKVEKTLY